MASPMTSVDTSIRPERGTDFAATVIGRRRQEWTLVVACFGVALVIASMIALNSALGDIAIATSATQTQLTWMVDGYTLVLACLLLPAGAIGDRYGRRGALLVGLAVFTLASIAPAFLHSPVQIIASRGLAGAGAALVMPATLSVLTVAYPKNQRTKAVGIWAGVAGTGAIIGMLGSGLLLRFWDWQSIFWALGAAGAAIFVLACTVTASRDADAPPVDRPGAVLIGSAVGVFVFGLLESPTRGWTDPVIIACLAGGVLVAGAFVAVELRRRKPLLDVRLFGSPAFATGAGTITVALGATFGFFYLCMQYVQQIMGYSALKSAIAFGPFMAPIAVLSAVSFLYLPKAGLRLVLFLGTLLMAAGFLCMLNLKLHSSYRDVAWPAMILSSGIGLCTAPTTSAIMSAVPDEKQGVASAVNDTTREVGAALGIAVAGSILASRYTHELLPRLTAFPDGVRGPASDSLAAAISVANKLGPQGSQLAEISKSAFLTAMHASTVVMAVIVAIAALLIGLWAPGRDGRQLRVVRSLRSRRTATT